MNTLSFQRRKPRPKSNLFCFSFVCLIFMYVCKCGVPLPTRVHEGTCRGQMLILDVFLNCISILPVFTWCFSLNLELGILSRLADQQVL